MKNSASLLITFLLLFSTNVFAKTFTSQFCEFELPNGWDCALEGSEWVCQSDNKDRKKEAIIILAAKYRGDQDSLDLYQAYLKAPKAFTLPGGKTQVSEAKSVAIREISNQRWVDALHLASEVPGFYTRYLATVKDSLGVAVTFSVAKDHYDAYQDIFEKIIATLKVFDQKSNKTDWKTKKEEGTLIDDGTYIPVGSDNPDISMQKKGNTGGGAGETGSIIAIIAVAGIAFAVMKMKKKKKKK